MPDLWNNVLVDPPFASNPPLKLASETKPKGAKALGQGEIDLQEEAKAAFAVENLAGRMTVVAGDGDAVVAVATVRAESEALASAMRFEQVRDKDGLPTLRVIYPLDRERRIRYPEAGDDGADSDHRGHHEAGRSSESTTAVARPRISRRGTAPQKRESKLLSRLSPIMK